MYDCGGLAAKSYLTLHDPIDCSPPGSSIHGLLQARIWSGLPFPSSGDLPNPGTEPRSPALQTDSLPSELHFLAIMNNAAMKISFCVNICFQFSLLDIELLDHIITLCLTF